MKFCDSLNAEIARWQRWLIDAAENQKQARTLTNENAIKPPYPRESEAVTMPVASNAGGKQDGAEGTRIKIPKALQRCEELAYYAACYAELKLERKLTAFEAYEYFKEYGFDEADSETSNASDLAKYQPPASFETFQTQLSRGRNAFNDRRNESRKGRKGRSIVTGCSD